MQTKKEKLAMKLDALVAVLLLLLLNFFHPGPALARTEHT